MRLHADFSADKMAKLKGGAAVGSEAPRRAFPNANLDALI